MQEFLIEPLFDKNLILVFDKPHSQESKILAIFTVETKPETFGRDFARACIDIAGMFAENGKNVETIDEMASYGECLAKYGSRFGECVSKKTKQFFYPVGYTCGSNCVFGYIDQTLDFILYEGEMCDWKPEVENGLKAPFEYMQAEIGLH